MHLSMRTTLVSTVGQLKAGECVLKNLFLHKNAVGEPLSIILMAYNLTMGYVHVYTLIVLLIESSVDSDGITGLLR